MARWTRSWSSALAIGLILAAPSLANEKPTKPAPSPTLPSSSSSSVAPSKKLDPDESRARTLFKDGQTAYDVGEFENALRLFTEAYKVKPLPGFLFNIAQCHRQLGNFKEAAFFFGRFIDNSKPEAANVELARELMTQMEKRLEASRPVDAPVATNLEPAAPVVPVLPPPPPPPAAEEPVYKKGWFWGVVGGAAAVVAAGVVVAVVASQPRVVPYTPVTTTLPDIDARTR
jgi:hypothetical protein